MVHVEKKTSQSMRAFRHLAEHLTLMLGGTLTFAASACTAY